MNGGLAWAQGQLLVQVEAAVRRHAGRYREVLFRAGFSPPHKGESLDADLVNAFLLHLDRRGFDPRRVDSMKAYLSRSFSHFLEDIRLRQLERMPAVRFGLDRVHDPADCEDGGIELPRDPSVIENCGYLDNIGEESWARLLRRLRALRLEDRLVLMLQHFPVNMQSPGTERLLTETFAAKHGISLTSAHTYLRARWTQWKACHGYRLLELQHAVGDASAEAFQLRVSLAHQESSSNCPTPGKPRHGADEAATAKWEKAERKLSMLERRLDRLRLEISRHQQLRPKEIQPLYLAHGAPSVNALTVRLHRLGAGMTASRASKKTSYGQSFADEHFEDFGGGQGFGVCHSRPRSPRLPKKEALQW